MDFILNEAQLELSALCRRILSGRVTEDRLRQVEAGGDRFDPALWADLASAGILAAGLPDSLGGASSVKDLIDVAGLPTTAGCRAVAERAEPAAADAACLAGLRAAAARGEAHLVGDAREMPRIRGVNAPVNLAGVPALALPVPAVGRLPASVQLIGPAGSEERLLAAGAVLEQATRA